VAGAFAGDLNPIWQETSANPYFLTVDYTPGGVAAATFTPCKIEQLALFADGSYKFTDQW